MLFSKERMVYRKMKVVQLCGKITELEPTVYWKNFQDAEDAIKKVYPSVIVINPVKLCNYLTVVFEGKGSPTYNHYMDVCLASLKNVDALIVMDNAYDSNGGRTEMKEAFKLGKDIMSMETFLG